MCIAEIVHLSAGFLYVRILGENDMYCLSCPLVRQLSICHNPTIKLYLFPRWSTCTPAVYMSESKQEMICIAQMVHLSAIFLYVRIITGNNMHCLDGILVCHLSICRNHNRKIYVFPRWSTCLPAVYMSEYLEKIICIVQMFHLSASCLYVRSLTGNEMYCLDGPLVCQLSINQTPNRE